MKNTKTLNKLYPATWVLFFCISAINMSCKRKITSFQINHIALQCDTNKEAGYILFDLSVTNTNYKDLIIDTSYFSTNKPTSSFLLVSKQLFTGAIRLKLADENSRVIIKKGSTKQLLLIIYYDELRHSLNTKSINKVSNHQIRTFLESNNYLLVYLSLEKESIIEISKSNDLKTECDLDFLKK